MIDPSRAPFIPSVKTLHARRVSLNPVVVEVNEQFGNQTAWLAVFHTRNLLGHRETSRCYVWSTSAAGPGEREFYALKKRLPVSPLAEAVRATVVSENSEESR